MAVNWNNGIFFVSSESFLNSYPKLLDRWFFQSEWMSCQISLKRLYRCIPVHAKYKNREATIFVTSFRWRKQALPLRICFSPSFPVRQSLFLQGLDEVNGLHYNLYDHKMLQNGTKTTIPFKSFCLQYQCVLNKTSTRQSFTRTEIPIRNTKLRRIFLQCSTTNETPKIEKDENSTKNILLPAGSLILVIGATGGVGQLTVKRLLDLGYRVRATARDLAKADSVLEKSNPNLEVNILLISRSIVLLDRQMRFQIYRRNSTRHGKCWRCC